MVFSVGIGIVTYDRKATLSETPDRAQAQAFARQPGTAFSLTFGARLFSRA